MPITPRALMPIKPLLLICETGNDDGQIVMRAFDRKRYGDLGWRKLLTKALACEMLLPSHKKSVTETPEYSLKQYYATKDDAWLAKMLAYFLQPLDGLLAECVYDANVREQILLDTIQQVRMSARTSGLHFDLTRGSLAGFLMSIVLEKACSYLVLKKNF